MIAAECAATGCTRPIPPSSFMCTRHWRMVPVPLRRPALRGFVLAREAAVAHITGREKKSGPDA